MKFQTDIPLHGFCHVHLEQLHNNFVFHFWTHAGLEKSKVLLLILHGQSSVCWNDHVISRVYHQHQDTIHLHQQNLWTNAVWKDGRYHCKTNQRCFVSEYGNLERQRSLFTKLKDFLTAKSLVNHHTFTKTTTTEYIQTSIVRLIHLHSKLCDCVNQVNDIFSVKLLISVAFMFVFIVFACFNGYRCVRIFHTCLCIQLKLLFHSVFCIILT